VLLLDCCYSGAVDDGQRGDVGSELHVVNDAHGFYILTASTSMQSARETALLSNGVVMGRFTAALVTGIESGAADQRRKGKILFYDLRDYLGHVVTGSTPQFFSRRASGNPLISLSPATMASSLGARMGRLAEMLRDPDADIRQHAAAALRAIRPKAAKAVPALAAALKEKDVRHAIAAALVAALKDPKDDVRHRAADALGKIGDAAVPALAAALNDPDKDVRRHAADALGKIGDAAVPALAAALNDPDEDVRHRAAGALESLQAFRKS
jgi:hypothetical protein